MAKATNTHAALFRAYDRCCDRIQVLEEDGEILLQDIESEPSETNYQWLSLVNKDLSKAYKLKTKIMDDINELDLYQTNYE